MEFKKFERAASQTTGPISWSPYWEVVLTYEKPDGQSSVSTELKRHFFVNRHINRSNSFDWTPRIGRNSPGVDETPTGAHVSAAALAPLPSEFVCNQYHARMQKWQYEEIKGGELLTEDDERTTHQRDWDFLAESIENEFSSKGITASADIVDKVQVLSELAASHRGRVYPSLHPVDVLMHSSLCAGAANLMIALCHVAGIPARLAGTAIHSMVETWNGKRWMFVDNFTKEARRSWLGSEPKGAVRTVFPDKNFVQVLLDPWGNDPEITSGQAQRYLERLCGHEPGISAAETLSWHFNQGGKGYEKFHTPAQAGSGLLASVSPETAHAVYPEWKEPILYSITGRENELIINPRQGWCKTVAWLDRGMAIRKTFYLGKIEPDGNALIECRCDLHLVDGFSPEFDPIRGGWELHVNGKPVRMDKNDTWQLRGDLLSINIPTDSLKENCENEIVLLSAKEYAGARTYRMPDSLYFWIHPDVFGIERPWYYPGKLADYMPSFYTYVGNSPVIDCHSTWLCIPDAL